jgi:hypothetical protein
VTNKASGTGVDFNFTIPPGADGVTPTIAVGTTTIGDPGVAMTLTAADESAACNAAFAHMQLEASSDSCDVSQALRRKLLAAAFDVDVLLSSATVDEDGIEAAISSLAAAGVDVSVTKNQPIDVLSSVPGLDAVALSSLLEVAKAAAAAKSQAEAAEVNRAKKWTI